LASLKKEKLRRCLSILDMHIQKQGVCIFRMSLKTVFFST